MQVVILTVGTEGDVRPLVALGAGLKVRGHRVRIATDPMFRKLIETYGLEHADLDGNFRGWMARDPQAMGQALKLTNILREFRHELLSMSRNWPEQGRAATQDADLIIGNGMVGQLGVALGQSLEIAHVETQLVPSFPSDHPPPIPLPNWMYGLPSIMNYSLGWLARLSLIYAIQPVYDQHVRPGLGLAPLRFRSPYASLHAAHLRLIGVSPSLIHRHRAWPENIQITGQWSLPANNEWQPPDHLREFLQAGAKPIYIGFGSMARADAGSLTELFNQVLRVTGKRAILATGWGGLEDAKTSPRDEIAVIDHAPHDWLFEQVSFAVHHGGAGTTHAAARAGIGSVVLPVFGDQPFWAARLWKLGVAAPAVKKGNANLQSLIGAFTAMDEIALQQRAVLLGQKLKAESGVEYAIQLMEQHGLLR